MSLQPLGARHHSNGVICQSLRELSCKQIEARSPRRGVIRSSLQPEETAGLTRSGDLTRMLPFEAHLLAAGWPRDSADGNSTAHCMGVADRRVPQAVSHKKLFPCMRCWCLAGKVSAPFAFIRHEQGLCCTGEPQEGNRAARRLHMVRRAERGLMSYDR